MYYRVTIRNSGIDQLIFSFGNWEDAAAFIDSALIHGDPNEIFVTVKLVLEFEQEEE